jgi:TolB-like protein/Flp pilus assembly protein TadD
MSGEAPKSGGGHSPTDPAAAVLASNGSIHVFISYASQDVAVADRIVETLERHGLKCWIAPRDVVPGESYAGAIVHAIDATKVIVLVLSENAASSQHVLREVERASSKRHPVVAFRIDAAPMPADLEYFLNTSQWLDASTLGVDTALPKLVDAVRRAVASPPIAIPAPPRATATRVADLSPAPPLGTKASQQLRRPVVAIITVIAVIVAYLVVDKFWLAKHVGSERPIAEAAPPAATDSPVISDKSIAVLPFVDMSEKKDQEYFADGMAEEIINLLTKVPDLHVPARTSSFYFKGKSTKVPDIARELGVADVLEGSIRRSGNQIRVTAQLVRADNGYHLWSETYDRDLQDVFKVQDDIANAVVQNLQITLMGGPLTRQKGGTQNLDAYQLYLRAVSARLQNTRASLEAERGYLDQAIKLDPTFGLAWVGLSFNAMVLTDDGALPIKEGYEHTRQLAQHALELSPELATAHAVLQYVHAEYDWDWAASEAEGRQALSLDPTDTSALMFTGMLSYRLGRWDDAERQLRSALARDPLDTYTNWHLATALYAAGRFADAEAAYRKLFAIAPNFLWTRTYLGKTLLAEGKPEEALAMVQQEDNDENRLTILPIALQAAGRKTEADEALKALITKFADSESYYVAMTYAYRGDHDLALQWLDHAYKLKDTGLVEMVGEPLLKNLANDPRYKAFLRKMNLPE